MMWFADWAPVLLCSWEIVGLTPVTMAESGKAVLIAETFSTYVCEGLFVCWAVHSHFMERKGIFHYEAVLWLGVSKYLRGWITGSWAAHCREKEPNATWSWLLHGRAPWAGAEEAPLGWLAVLTAPQVQIHSAVIPLEDELTLPSWASRGSKLVSLCRLHLLHASAYVLEPSRRVAAWLWQGCSQWLVAQVATDGQNSGWMDGPACWKAGTGCCYLYRVFALQNMGSSFY